MGRKKGEAALAAGREHLTGAGDKEAGEAAPRQGEGAEGAGDKGGEGRKEYVLSGDQRNNLELVRGRAYESDAAGQEAEAAFWTQIAPPMGFNPVTVETGEDVLESGLFTAWPSEQNPGPEPEPVFNPATNEADHDASVARIEAIANALVLDAGSPIGQVLIATTLDIYRTRHKPWNLMTEREKRDVTFAIDAGVKTFLREAVKELARRGQPSIPAKLETYTDKAGEITAKIAVVGSSDEIVLAMHRASGKMVQIVVADADALMGEEIEIPGDQDELFEAGSDVEEEEAEEEAEADARYASAIEAVREKGQGGMTSYLQRSLQIGHAAAEALVERMEREGILSAADESGQRTALPPPGDEAGESGDHGEKASAEAPAETAEA
jgi:hypothetical protein